MSKRYSFKETTTAGSVAAVAMPLSGTKKRKKTHNPDGTIKNALDSKQKLVNSGDKYTNKGRNMKKKTNENLADMAHVAEKDHEVQMARADLYKIAKYAIKLHEMLRQISEAEGLEGWQQAKITKASDYISAVYHNLDYSMKFDGAGELGEGKGKYKSDAQRKAVHAAKADSDYKKKMRENLEDQVEAIVSEKWKGDAEIEPTGEYSDRTVASLRKEYKKLKDSGPHAKGSDDYEKMRELAFAIRAKTGWGKVEEKAVSRSQQKAAGAALAAKRGDMPKSKLKGASKRMVKMSTAELEKYAGTKHKGLPKKVAESQPKPITEAEFDEAAGEKDACYHKVKSRYKVWPSAYACVPEDSSKALTKDGWKSYNELKVGEEIMTYNIEKNELEFKPILNLHYYLNADTIVFSRGNTGFKVESTPNHRWVTKLPKTKSNKRIKYERIANDISLIETEELLQNKNNKHIVSSATYNGGEPVLKDKIYKYTDNWTKYVINASKEQREAWLYSAIVYDGDQRKTQRLNEKKNNISESEWAYDGNHGKQSFGFKQKNIDHRDAFLLSAFMNSGSVSWKKYKNKDIYSCYYVSNKPLQSLSNIKLIERNIKNVWCPETENSTWVMMQENNSSGIITITGNSGALAKCRKVGAKNWGNKSKK